MHGHPHPHPGPWPWWGGNWGGWGGGWGGDTYDTTYNVYNQPELVEDDNGNLYWLYPDGTTVFYMYYDQRAAAGI